MNLATSPLIVSAVLSQMVGMRDAPTADDIQHLLNNHWRFECQYRNDEQAIVAVSAGETGEQHAHDFLRSLHHLERLVVVNRVFKRGDLRALADCCPGLRSIHLKGWGGAAEQPLPAEFCSELLDFGQLARASLANVGFAGNEQPPGSAVRGLESLDVSGNLAGRLPVLLTPYMLKSLRIELLGRSQQPTANDLAALNRQVEIASLSIIGNRFDAPVEIDLRRIRNLTKIRQLTLRNCRIDPADLVLFPSLDSLTLISCTFKPKSFDALFALPNLKTLTLSECNNGDLGITGPCDAKPVSLQTIVFQLPVFADLESFQHTPVSINLQLGSAYYDSGGTLRCALSKPGKLWRIGEREAGFLEKMRGLRGVSICQSRVTASAVVRMAALNTIRTLRIEDAHIDGSLTPVAAGQLGAALREVAFWPIGDVSEDFARSMMSSGMTRVSVTAFSNKDNRRQDKANLNQVRFKNLKFAVLSDYTFPVSTRSLADEFLTPSLQELVLHGCSLRQGAVRQLARKCPSLKRVILVHCSFAEERELLRLNELKHLEHVDLTNSSVSARTALALTARTVRFGKGTYGIGYWRSNLP